MITKTVEYYTISELKERAEEEGHKTSGCLSCKNAYERALEYIRNEYVADYFDDEFEYGAMEIITKAGFDYNTLTKNKDIHYSISFSQSDYVHVCTQDNKAVNLSQEVLKAIGYERWEFFSEEGVYITRKRSSGFRHVVTFELHEDECTNKLNEEEFQHLEEFIKAKFQELDNECEAMGRDLMMPSNESLFEYAKEHYQLDDDGNPLQMYFSGSGEFAWGAHQ